jgi:hypothetical protein
MAQVRKAGGKRQLRKSNIVVIVGVGKRRDDMIQPLIYKRPM